MKVSIIIANHRVDKLFFNTVKSVLANLPKGAELVVVNNGMKIKQADKVRSWLKDKSVKLLQMQEANPSKARNSGVRVAKGEYLVFLDNDTEVEKGWLDKVVKYMDKHSKAGAGQLKLLRLDKKRIFDSAGDKLTANGFLVERAREAEDKGQFDKDDCLFSGKGAAMLVRKKVFDQVGGFDEDYVYYWEEPDLFWRVWQAGYEVRWLWMGKVYHAYGTKDKPTAKVPASKQVFLAYKNQLMTIYKNGKGRRRWRMLFWVGLSWLGLQSLFLLKGRLRQFWAVEQAWWWLMFHFKRLKQKRSWVKRSLKGDGQWLKQVMVKPGLGWYVGKGLAYILGKPF